VSSESINENVDKDDVGIGTKNQIEEKTPAAGGEAELKPGEKFFTGVLLSLGIFFFWHAWQLWQQVSPPRDSSAAAIPLIMTGLWVVLTLYIFIQNIRKKTPLSGLKLGGKVWSGLLYLFPKDVLIVLGVIAVYCALLLLRFSFFVVTVPFLYGIMCYLTRKNFLKNILWTAIVIIFTVVVFGMLFNIRFP